MLIKFDVESDLYLDIQDLIKEGKYPDIYEFIKLAILNQIQEEKADSRYSEDSRQKIRGIVKEIIPPLDNRKKWVDELEDFEKKFSFLEVTIEDKLVKKIDEDLIWSFYNRFLPLKIIITELARMITQEKQWIDLEELRENAVYLAQDMCDIIKKRESENHTTRNKKISIGLPTHPNELDGIKKKTEKIKMENKIESSRNRFMNQFVGTYNKKKQTFEGACFSMGLMNVRISGSNILVTLSDLGRQLALIKNPVINEFKITAAFTNDETRFIYERIIPQFKLEQQIIKDVISELKKKGTLTSKELDLVFKEHEKLIIDFYYKEPKKLDYRKQHLTIEQARVATMGRLSELGIVDWTSDSSGISHYSLSKEKSELLGL